MARTGPALGAPMEPLRAEQSRRGRFAGMRGALIGGGTEGNEQLTAVTGALLIVLLAVLGVTIVRIGQLIWLHLFVGLLLIGPIVLKMASTAYRFVNYYGGTASYRRKGPPPLSLRLIAPAVVLTTVLVFATGLVLLFLGPAHRGSWSEIHKVSFIVWAGFAGLHLLGHLPGLPTSLRAAERERSALGGLPPGEAGRWIAIAGMCAAGLVLALLLLPQFGAWTAHGALAHHHHHG